MAGENDKTLDSAVDEVFGSTMGVEQNADPQVQQHEDADEGGDEQQVDGQQSGDQQQQLDPYDGLAPPLGGKPQRDANGNIIDKDGRVVASNREERRELYNFNRLRVAAEKIKETNVRLEKQLDGYKQIAEMPGKLGLTQDDVVDAMQLRANFDRDPVSTVREVVARAMNLGHTMEDLFGSEGTGFINGQMVKQQIDQHLRPLNERFAANEREERIARDAQSAYDTFIADHEYADLHGDAIAGIAERNEMSPEKAYYELRLWSQQNGLDFTQPLEPQVQERVKQHQQQQQPSQRQPAQQRQQPSLPGNRRVVSPSAPATPANNYASPDASFRDIVAAAMFEQTTQ